MPHNENNMNFKFTDMKIEIELPNGFMNTAVTSDNFFIADTNNSANWDRLKFPLPKGKWSIYSTSNKKVILQKSRVNLLFIFSVVFSFLCGGKKKPKQTCKNCRFNCDDNHTCMNDCNVGSYYAEKGLHRICYEGELWEGK